MLRAFDDDDSRCYDAGDDILGDAFVVTVVSFVQLRYRQISSVKTNLRRRLRKRSIHLKKKERIKSNQIKSFLLNLQEQKKLPDYMKTHEC